MVGFNIGSRGEVSGKGKTCINEEIIIQFNSIQFFIISVLHQQPEGQLQMQHKG
jgi:hypothetical protein